MILWAGSCQETPPKSRHRHVYHLLLGSQTWWLHISTLIIFNLHKLFTTLWLCSTTTQGSCSHSWLLGTFNLHSLEIIIIYGFCLQLFQIIISKWFSSLQNPLLLTIAPSRSWRTNLFSVLSVQFILPRSCEFACDCFGCCFAVVSSLLKTLLKLLVITFQNPQKYSHLFLLDQEQQGGNNLASSPWQQRFYFCICVMVT